MSKLISFKKENTGQVLLAVLFVIYLIMGYQTPQPVADIINTVPGKLASSFNSCLYVY